MKGELPCCGQLLEIIPVVEVKLFLCSVTCMGVYSFACYVIWASGIKIKTNSRSTKSDLEQEQL